MSGKSLDLESSKTRKPLGRGMVGQSVLLTMRSKTKCEGSKGKAKSVSSTYRKWEGEREGEGESQENLKCMQALLL